jgi:hypothetical protein
VAAPDLGSAIFPGAVEHTLVNKRTGEQRQFVQTELSIEGEARLLALVRDIGARLTQSEFPWDLLADLFSDQTAPLDWDKALNLLGSVAEVAPDAVVESSLILFGIFPTNDDGTRNPEYEDARRFLLKAVTVTRWTDLIKVYIEQNEYQRMADNFGRALAAGAAQRRPAGAPNGSPSAT